MAHWGSRHVSVEKLLEGARKKRSTTATLRRHRNLEKDGMGSLSIVLYDRTSDHSANTPDAAYRNS